MSKLTLYSGLFMLGSAFGAGVFFFLQFSQQNQFEIWTAKESIFLNNGSRISKGSVMLTNLNPRCELTTNPSGSSSLALLFLATPDVHEKFEKTTSSIIPYGNIKSEVSN